MRRIGAVTSIACDPTKVHTGVVCGDSTSMSDGVGAWRAPLVRANPGLTLVGRLYSGGYNEAYNGYRIDQVAALVLPAIDVSMSPDVALVMLGANDIAQGESVAATFTEIQTFCTDLLAKTSITKVMLSTIVVGSNAFSASYTTYNASILGWSPPAGITVHDTTNTLVYPDDYFDTNHPNTAGYAKVAARWSTAVQSVLFP